MNADDTGLGGAGDGPVDSESEQLAVHRGRDVTVTPTNQCSTWELPGIPKTNRPDRGSVLLRKEVIQPHLPVRLPCYDFTPIADPTFDGSLPKGLGHRLRVLPTFVV